MRLIGKLLCWLYGHRRGRRDQTAIVLTPNRIAYRCPRCAFAYTRRARRMP